MIAAWEHMWAHFDNLGQNSPWQNMIVYSGQLHEASKHHKASQGIEDLKYMRTIN